MWAGLSVVGLLSLASSALSDPVIPGSPVPRADGPNYVHFPVRATIPSSSPASRRGKRQDSEVNVSAANGGLIYLIDVQVGTPGQNVSLQLDTGSAELWVNPNCTWASNQAGTDLCGTLGVFDSTASSTFQSVGPDSYELHYGFGNALVDYVLDTVTVGCECCISADLITNLD
jgi:hypothetical protein